MVDGNHVQVLIFSQLGSVLARFELALRYCVAAILGIAVVVGSIVVLTISAIALAVVGDVPPKRSIQG